jgi:hypothetical protein
MNRDKLLILAAWGVPIVLFWSGVGWGLMKWLAK